MCWKDGGRLGGLILGNYRGQYNGRGENVLHVHDQGGLGKHIGLGPTFKLRARGYERELVGGVWFVRNYGMSCSYTWPHT
jgi:hypothetical protein